jgi:hypothetical protein
MVGSPPFAGFFTHTGGEDKLDHYMVALDAGPELLDGRWRDTYEIIACDDQT